MTTGAAGELFVGIDMFGVIVDILYGQEYDRSCISLEIVMKTGNI